MDDFEKIYSKEVIEFVTVANQYCILLEGMNELSKKELIDQVHKILPLLYLKGTLLPKIEFCINEEGNEKFVDEHLWQDIHGKLFKKIGKHDTYLEVFDPLIHDLDEPVTSSISEHLADIYQDIKDFIMLYRIGTNDIMNDAVWEVRLQFEQYWGQKLVNVSRALHNVYYSENPLDEEEEQFSADDENHDIDTSSWFITKRQEELRKGNEDDVFE